MHDGDQKYESNISGQSITYQNSNIKPDYSKEPVIDLPQGVERTGPISLPKEIL